MKDDIKLPPEFISMNDIPVTVATIKRGRMLEILRETIKADRQQRGMMPGEPFAIVTDRMWSGERHNLAIWDGDHYQFSDGDCYDRDGDTLDDCATEWLTHYQLEQRLFSDRQQRGEPVGNVEIKGGLVVVGVDAEHLGDGVHCLYTDPQPTAPAQEPNDEELLHAIIKYADARATITENRMAGIAEVDRERDRLAHDDCAQAYADMTALLARYGNHHVEQSGVSEGWHLVPKVPTHEMIVAFVEQWYCHRQSIDDPQMDDAYQAMLAAAPEPPCET